MKAVFRMCFLGSLLVFNFLAVATAVGQPFGLSNRVANTTLRMPLSPPVFGYTSTNGLGNLTFTAPVAIVSAPGETNRLFVVEQSGVIVVITNLANPTRTVFMDISGRVRFNGEEGLLGLAFHPGYVTNRFFYVFYVLYTNTVIGASTRHDRLSRFEISPSNTNQGLSGTEVVMINQKDDFSNHNAGDLHFGDDGYLYVSLGDEGDANDTGANSQRIDKDFFASIIRIDVDSRPDSVAPNPHPAVNMGTYLVPTNNPFLGATQFNGSAINPANVRTEIWAIGLRNPWRWSFDRASGLLYCGDVGQGAREEVDIIVRGGNYGWNYREGKIARPGSTTPPAGFSAIDPILDYPRTPSGATNVGFSITGGVVYHGDRLPDLDGAYVFGDYGSGNVWALRHTGTNVTAWWQLFGDAGVAAFGIDPSNGDVLYADVSAGTIRRIIKTVASGGVIPATLADTGAFTNLAMLTPNPGIVPYDVNVPVWSDNAILTRWFSITNPGVRITFRSTNLWTLPAGTVWIQHFDLELTNGIPESRRRLETRFLVRDATSSGAYGVTYRWNDPPTNATLVADAGMDETFLIHDGATIRTQVWHYPGRSECLVCHTVAGNRALGFNTPQMNRDFLYPNGVTDNQLRSLNNAGYFSVSISNLHSFPLLTRFTNGTFSMEHRVRSYLMANCSQCHQGAAGFGMFDTRIYRPISTLRIIDGALNNSLGDTNNRVVKPGSLDNSVLLTRLSSSDPSLHMPPLGTTLLDSQAIQAVSYWITNELANYLSFADWQIQHFGSTNAPDALATADPDMDGGSNFQEYLTGTNPTNALEAWGISIAQTGGNAEIIFPRIANRGFEAQWTSVLSSNTSWQFLNVPENRPFFSVTNLETRISEPITNAPVKFYRVRVYEP